MPDRGAVRGEPRPVLERRLCSRISQAWAGAPLTPAQVAASRLRGARSAIAGTTPPGAQATEVISERPQPPPTRGREDDNGGIYGSFCARHLELRGGVGTIIERRERERSAGSRSRARGPARCRMAKKDSERPAGRKRKGATNEAEPTNREKA